MDSKQQTALDASEASEVLAALLGVLAEHGLLDVESRSTAPGDRHPTQPTVIDDHGWTRFKCNAIVARLLDEGPFDMNWIAVQDFSDEDRRQFAQLIGYSVSGYQGLSYATEIVEASRDGAPSADASEASEVQRLLDVIDRAIEASDNDGGSASDAIQDMLAILDEAREP